MELWKRRTNRSSPPSSRRLTTETIGLLEGGAPADEYAPEIETIGPRVLNAHSVEEVTTVLHEELGLAIGALSGAAAGTVFGLAVASWFANEGHEPAEAFIPVFALSMGAGAGIGAGLDAAITGSTSVYP
jgi:hypothetical protein